MNALPALDALLARPDVWRGGQLAGSGIPAVSSGFPVLDEELPGYGWPRGNLTEILIDGVGLGECALLQPALAGLSAPITSGASSGRREDGAWALLVAPPYGLNAPAWSAVGVDPARLAIVASPRQRDAFWATEQALASGAFGIVLCWAKQADAPITRRLQVALAGSKTLAFLFRPLRARTESSAAALRLMLTAGPHGTLGVDLLKRRGPPCSRTLYLDVPRPLAGVENRPASGAIDKSSERGPSSIVGSTHVLHPAVARAASAASSARSLRPLAVA